MFFFFVAAAGVSIIVWVFNWICWYNQCCCCDFLHNPVNKRLVWWTSFIFALGILACCISGFVTTNRFGFALEGSKCSFYRMYYDSKYGQLQEVYPKWEGFEKILEYLTNLEKFVQMIKDINFEDFTSTYVKSDNKQIPYDGYYYNDFLINGKDKINDPNFKVFMEYIFPITSRFGKVLDSIQVIQNFDFVENIDSLKDYFDKLGDDFKILKTEFLEEFDYYAKVGKACGKVLTMIYFCLLCITITFAGISMMFYACLRRQGYLKLFMHVLWNIVRFFIFSYFFYGAAYGMCYLALRDAVAYVMFIFGEDNLNLEKPFLVPEKEGKAFLQFCLLDDDSNYKNKLDIILVKALNDFFTNYQELYNLFLNQYNNIKIPTDIKLTDDDAKMLEGMQHYFTNNDVKDLCKNDCGDFPEMALRDGGIFGSFNCTFLRSDLAMMYRTVYDLSIEARILCALSCCIGFFGAIFVYFFLLVMHHYDNDIFFEQGKSIFTGFDGYGNTRKKNLKDPSYKKRKIRSEIELSSRNEEYSGYQPANKNEE
jgi:hypothetical protein